MRQNNEEIIEFFNKKADNWDSLETLKHDDLVKLLKLLDIKANDKVLDLACGTGIISEELFLYSKNEVDAIDISEIMIKKAKEKKIPNVNFICADFNDFDSNCKYDYIVCFNAYPHFIDIEKFKLSILKNLKIHGKLAIFHSSSRKNINDFHHNINSSISRNLEKVDYEFEFYKDHFKMIKSIDEDNYLFILEKIR